MVPSRTNHCIDAYCGERKVHPGLRIRWVRLTELPIPVNGPQRDVSNGDGQAGSFIQRVTSVKPIIYLYWISIVTGWFVEFATAVTSIPPGVLRVPTSPLARDFP